MTPASCKARPFFVCAFDPLQAQVASEGVAVLSLPSLVSWPWSAASGVEFLFCLSLLTRQVQFFSCYGSFGCLLSGSMYSRKNCPPESAFHFWNGGFRVRCSHGGNLHLLHAVNRPLRGASVNLGCFFLCPGTHGSKLTPLPGLCQPWLLSLAGARAVLFGVNAAANGRSSICRGTP